MGIGDRWYVETAEPRPKFQSPFWGLQDVMSIEIETCVPVQGWGMFIGLGIGPFEILGSGGNPCTLPQTFETGYEDGPTVTVS